MIKRVILLVVEGLGVGATDDASTYGDSACHTLAHLAETAGGLSLPTLESLGLGHVTTIQGVRSMAQPVGCFGRLGFKSKGVDSLVGYWEIAGCLAEEEGRTFPNGYSKEAIAAVEAAVGHKVVGGRVASGEEALVHRLLGQRVLEEAGGAIRDGALRRIVEELPTPEIGQERRHRRFLVPDRLQQVELELPAEHRGGP
jgi:phosphopentomutase